MDWTATILAVTGTAPDPAFPLDGENLMPVCTGERGVHDRALFWRITTFDAARVGKWKYLKDTTGARTPVRPVDGSRRESRSPAEGARDIRARQTAVSRVERADAADAEAIMTPAVRILVVVLVAAAAAAAQPVQPTPMNTIAERYVKLVLAVGQHDADYVDAFYGPAEWKTEAERAEAAAARDRRRGRAADRRHPRAVRSRSPRRARRCCGTTI